ncbi:MmcQ/YjbR family DNA-binding protein [uncultured Pontibacter sp.]|uniref:MmcQ/YjbR family DNA-binding protein n=1 Tax=uncultured Pontibacter sp. TaxID=453356 RepID=UPI00260A5216|nr:MmcQ/YjbR family DNA-binding protein [uncultured Pontibacter sp.]
MNIEALRALCLSLPGATEDIRWGADLCFLVGGKMFCATSIDPPHQVSFKVTDEDFGALTVSTQIVPAPYLARYKWVQVQQWTSITDEAWQTYVKQSYEMVKAKLPKSKLKALEV